jgi:uncharacterized protein YbjT (DUF2867 family)
MRILVTGISGYVGGTLAPRLIETGHDVVGLSRHPEHTGTPATVCRGDLASGLGLAEALEGIEVAYYLAHSLEAGNREGFAMRDQRMANNFVAAAQDAGVRRVIYLGVIDAAEPAARSAHQRSRLEVDETLRGTTRESLSLRASVIIGAGNWFMQAVVKLLKRVPVIALPAGGRPRMQPIDERDVVECLVAAGMLPRDRRPNAG